MITTEILTKNPFAKRVIMKWFMEKMIESFKNESVPQEMIEYMRENGISDERLIDALNVNPRMLFDVLDENDVLVQVNVNFQNKTFSYNINDGEIISGGFKNRKDCEIHAIVASIVSLNEKLRPEDAVLDEENTENQ